MGEPRDPFDETPGLIRPQNEAEQTVLREASAAGTADFSSDAALPVVRASFLRALLIGLSVKLGEAPGVVRSTGLRIKAARIVDELDFRDCTGPGGGPLPPLVLEHCELPDPIDVSFAHLARLSINHSRFRCIQAEGTRMVGSFSFVSARPFDPPDDAAPGPAFIDAGGARIDGDVDGRRSLLRAPSARVDPNRTQFALRLAVCDIGGRLAFDEAEFEGGVSIADSDVRGTVWLSGARLAAGDAEALLARGARLRSTLSMGASSAKQFVSDGEISLVGANVAGRLICRGANLNGRNARASGDEVGLGPVAIRADNAHIGGHTLLDGTTAEGQISLAGATIEGDLDCSDACFTAGSSDTCLNASNADIRGGLYLGRLVARGRLALWNAKVGHGFHADAARLTGSGGVAIDAGNLQIAGDLNLGERDGQAAEISGRANFARCEISRNLNLNGLVVSAVPGDRTEDGEQSVVELIFNHVRIGAPVGLP